MSCFLARISRVDVFLSRLCGASNMAVSDKDGKIKVQLVRAVILCRHHEEKVSLVLPCNWVRQGFCGVDCLLCDLSVVERVL